MKDAPAAKSALRIVPDYGVLREQFLQHRDSLPKRLAQAAAYALDNPDEIAFGTTAKIAEAAGVQPSALIRLAQHFGFDGFTSLQAVFRERMRGRPVAYEERLEALRGSAAEGGGARAILDGFVEASRHSLESIAQSVDAAALERATNLLARADTIYLVARRRSYAVAVYLAYALSKLGIRNCLVEYDVGLEGETLSFATPKDAAIAISFSPYAPATTVAARDLATAGVPVVSITDSAFSPLASLSREWFEIVEADCAGFRSLSAAMALALTLAVAVGAEREAAGH